jgi:hypothetical protein
MFVADACAVGADAIQSNLEKTKVCRRVFLCQTVLIHDAAMVALRPGL